MATVSHYAMQPYSAFYGDGSTQLSSSQYYVASNQQFSPMYDKTKKTWSQRLKITKTEKATSPLSELPDYSPSALSRSMKYAEPWLYGTVRGIPARPVHGQAIFTPFPAEVAVVVCSCPEYLNGTKREVKKASVCKKCKGSRLPLAPIGGTVRIRPTSAPIVHAPRTSVGTVRILSSSGKSRPSILDPKNDPYDLMRRSRLVSPEPKPSSVDKTLKMRAKSASPTRGRSRSRPARPEDLPLSSNASTISSGLGNIRPRGTIRMKQERWLESMENDPRGRKSILMCEVNPYDLISNKAQTINEFAPEQEEMFLPSPSSLKTETGTKRTATSVGNGSNVKAIAGQRISLGESMSKNPDHLRFERNLSTETTSIPRKREVNTQQEINRREKSSSSNSFKQPVSMVEQIQPKRPPRKKQETSSADEDSSETLEECTKPLNDQTSTKIHVTPPPSIPTQSMDSVSVTSPSKRQGIKSILKRPSPVSLSSGDIDAKSNESYHAGKTSPSTTNIGKSIVETKRLTFATEKSSPSEERRSINGSQFYCPLPQTRKKVQFMVENRIIHHKTDDDGAEQMIMSSTVAIDGNQEESVTLKPWREHRIEANATNDVQILRDTNSLGGEKEQQNLRQDLSQNFIETDRERNKSIRESCANDLTNSVADSATMNSKENGVIVINPGEKHSHEMDKYKGRIIMKDNIVRDGGDQQYRNRADTDSNTKIVAASPNLHHPTTRRCISLRRTHSARSNNTTTVLLNFNDTMALRIKNPRPDSRDIFAGNGGDSLSSSSSSPSSKLSLPSSIPRPYGNPPEPPLSPLRIHQQDSALSSPGSLMSSLMAPVEASQPAAPADVVISSSSSLPQTSGKSKKSLSPAARGSKSTSTADRNPSRNELHQHKNNDDSQLKEPTRVVVGESFVEAQPARPPRQVNKKISWHQENGTSVTVKNEHQNNPLKDNGSNISNGVACGANKETSINGNKNALSHENEEKNAFVQGTPLTPTEPLQKPVYLGKMSEQEKILLARNEILNGSRLFGSIKDKGVQKTVVRVAPFNRDGLEVHRLKIRHEDDINTTQLVSPQKTSILINGDNCYSTVNVCSDTPLYQSSVVVNNGVSTISTDTLKISSNTVTISVSNPSTPEDEIICQNNKINSLLSFNNNVLGSALSPSSSSSFTGSDGDSSSYSGSLKRGSTLITLDFGTNNQPLDTRDSDKDALAHERELVQILRNPVEAVKRNLIPHVCGKSDIGLMKTSFPTIQSVKVDTSSTSKQQNSFINKLLEDPTLNQLAEGLESEVVVKLIENSLKRLKDSRRSLDTSGTKDSGDMDRLIDLALQKVKEERTKLETTIKSDVLNEAALDHHENGSISSGNSYGSANYDVFDFDNNESDCYQSCSSEMTTEEDAQSTRSKFYQMLVDATLSEIEITTSNDDDHHYESIRMNCDPIYEEISDVPPPLPLSPPPVCDSEMEKKTTKSMFEGASKYDILSYLVDAKERGLVREEPYEYNFCNTSDIIIEEEIDTLSDLNKKKIHDISSRVSHLSVTSDSSEDISLTSSISEKLSQRRPASEVERNDSGVGSETSKSSRSKYQNPTSSALVNKNSPIHLCEDCDGPVETQITNSGVMYAPLVCRKCSKKRAERKEIIIEIVETEEKYGRDLQIILEEFCKPMLVAGLLTQEQLSAIFLNTEELIENNLALAEKMRDALDIALDQGDDDLLTVNAGKIFLESTPMLHAFESYCVRQAGASLLLANLEKDKELLRIFLRVSQMENAVLRRMNLNSFLMVPVQRVTKYPLLLARLYKVTPSHLISRPLLKQATEKIELHLNHMNEEAKDVPTKLWRRISSSSPNRRLSCEIDMINIKLRKMSIDVLEWNHDEVRFAMEGKLLYTQPTDSNWKKARTIKLTHINALLVTNGKPSVNYKPEKAIADQLSFPKHTGIREASLLMVKEKGGRYTLIREPLYLDRCIVCTEADWDDYFEVHEISTKETFIFKAEDGTRTKQWYTLLQYHSQNMGAWRKRRNALANIMINGMLSRS